jgi:hypothetical protein
MNPTNVRTALGRPLTDTRGEERATRVLAEDAIG